LTLNKLTQTQKSTSPLEIEDYYGEVFGKVERSQPRLGYVSSISLKHLKNGEETVP